ncbi:MAG: 30S ribosomal protein S19 [Candidatus Woesearchaeota archaeon]|nr:30S ribosomal protein S19 [Candidatus Woesearchaeota archaeon]
MALKEFAYRGKTLQELQKMDLKEFIKLLPSRQRRSLSHGFTDQQKILLNKINKAREGKYKKIIKTHIRDLVVLPSMIDLTIHIHDGRTFVPVILVPEMIGCYLGELTYNRKRVTHSAPGIGATRSSAGVQAK